MSQESQTTRNEERHSTSGNSSFLAGAEFRVCTRCNPNHPVHGHLSEKGGSAYLPIPIASLFMGKKLLQMGKSPEDEERHIARIEREMRDVGLPEVLESEDEDERALKEFVAMVMPPTPIMVILEELSKTPFRA